MPASNGATVEPAKAAPVRWRVPPLLIGVALAGMLVIAGILAWRALVPAAVVLVTTPVQQGALLRTVTSSGTVNPQNTISVGSQISGTISEIDADYNSIVKTGQVLARIDPTLFQASLDQAQAQLTETDANARVAVAGAVGAHAGVAVQSATADAAAQNVAVARSNASAQADAIAAAQASVAKAQAALVLAQLTMTRDASLLSQGYTAANVVDADRASLETAQSGLSSAQATLIQARSQAVASAQQANQAVAQSQAQNAQNTVAGAQAQASTGTAQAQTAAIGVLAAQVRTAQYNLAHTTITSPVNGTVIVRNVALGETVAASFSTPVLFTIAQDLSKMEVDLAVGEPDIGAVKKGDPVTFTVLAYPNTFAGTVSQVRQSPTVVSNVVTYDTVVIVDNKAGLLRPGMTANAFIQTQKVAAALIVPLQALEYQPSAAVTARYHLSRPVAKVPAHALVAGTVGSAAGSQFGATMGAGATTLAPGSRGRVFVSRAGALVAVPVQILLTAATQAAVKPLRGTLQAGDAVVTADGSASQPASAPHTSTAAFGQATQGGGAARAVR
ncbi:MAG: efflux RND transporter periplasmic adaptor subunit [Vulcanimicrobiaceae bacterium]